MKNKELVQALVHLAQKCNANADVVCLPKVIDFDAEVSGVISAAMPKEATPRLYRQLYEVMFDGVDRIGVDGATMPPSMSDVMQLLLDVAYKSQIQYDQAERARVMVEQMFAAFAAATKES